MKNSILEKYVKINENCDGTFPVTCIGKIGILKEIDDIDGENPPYIILFSEKHSMNQNSSYKWRFNAHNFTFIDYGE